MINNRSNPDCYLQQIIIAVTTGSDGRSKFRQNSDVKVIKVKLGTHWFVWAPAGGVPWVMVNNDAPIWIDLVI